MQPIKKIVIASVAITWLFFEWSHAAGVETIYVNKSKTTYLKSKTKHVTVIKTGIFANRKPAVEIPNGKRWTQLGANDCICVYGKKREIHSINYDQHRKRYAIQLFKFEKDLCKKTVCQPRALK